jgi:hypothetical protein
MTEDELKTTNPSFRMLYTDERYINLYNEYYNDEINKSKKSLSNYLGVIKENESKPELKIYNLYTSRKTIPQRVRGRVRDISREHNLSIDPGRDSVIERYPYDTNPIEKHSEILVSIPHLTPDYFVLCTVGYVSSTKDLIKKMFGKPPLVGTTPLGTARNLKKQNENTTEQLPDVVAEFALDDPKQKTTPLDGGKTTRKIKPRMRHRTRKPNHSRRYKRRGNQRKSRRRV